MPQLPEYYTHRLAVFASTNRRQTITGVGVLIWELKSDRSASKPLFRHSEAYHHARMEDVQPVAVVRALELALENGYTRLQLCSNYYHSKRRPHGYSRFYPWCRTIQVKLAEITEAFTVLHFGSLGRLEPQVRALARRAVASGKTIPVRERAPYFEPLDVDFLAFLANDVDPDRNDPENPPFEGSWSEDPCDETEVPF